MKKTILTILFMFLVTTNIGCSSDEYKIYLHSDIFNETITINEKQTLDISNIKDESYLVEGIYLDQDFTKKFDLSTPITQNYTLYIKWVEKPILTLNTLGGKTEIPTVYKIDSIQKEFDLTYINSKIEKFGFYLKGWVDETGKFYENSILIKENVNLYAKWEITTFDDQLKNQYFQNLANLTELEYLIGEFNKEYDTNYDPKLFTLIYIRSYTYNDFLWNILAGTYDTRIDTFLKENSEFAPHSLRTLEYFPTIDTNLEFQHFCATLNLYMKDPKALGDLGGWAGDIVQLTNEIKNESADINRLKEIAISKLGSSTSSFNYNDLIADIDARNIYYSYSKDQDLYLSEIIYNYYSNIQNRIFEFLTGEFKNVNNIESLTTEIISRILENSYIVMLFNQYGIDYETTHKNHLYACCYAFANYLIKNV